MIKQIIFLTVLSLGSSRYSIAEDKAPAKENNVAPKLEKVAPNEENPAPKVAKKEKTKMVELVTNMGRIVIELDEAKAPISSANFIKYVKADHYKGTIFHRVINGFMIQGGNMDENMKPKKTEKPITNEADNGLKNARGTVAMARTNDPNSATDQFFINVVDNVFLNHKSKNPAEYGYAVFGKVTEGMDVVDKIKAVETGDKGHFSDVPVKTVVIQSAKLL